MGAEQEDMQNQEESYVEPLEPEPEESSISEEPMDTKSKTLQINIGEVDKSGFINGIAVGLGIASIATFVIVWISVYFTPRIASQITYENLLSIFVYPLIYLLAVGLIALTAGIVREYYATRNRL